MEWGEDRQANGLAGGLFAPGVAALLYFFERDNGKVQDAATWTYYLFLPF